MVIIEYIKPSVVQDEEIGSCQLCKIFGSTIKFVLCFKILLYARQSVFLLKNCCVLYYGMLICRAVCSAPLNAASPLRQRINFQINKIFEEWSTCTIFEACPFFYILGVCKESFNPIYMCRINKCKPC